MPSAARASAAGRGSPSSSSGCSRSESLPEESDHRLCGSLGIVDERPVSAPRHQVHLADVEESALLFRVTHRQAKDPTHLDRLFPRDVIKARR